MSVKELEKPFILEGIVAKGFGRGGKLLGCPTANIPLDGNEKVIDEIDTGIYCGYALLGGEVYPMVTSIGWNPHFKNEHKTIEPHLICKFESDFYDQHLKIIICGFIRGEKSYDSLESLMEAINNDIKISKETLSTDNYKKYTSILRGE